MPVTLPAHQAAVLPLMLRWPRLDALALVLGTMAPDLAYVFVGTFAEFESHYAVAGIAGSMAIALAWRAVMAVVWQPQAHRLVSAHVIAVWRTHRDAVNARAVVSVPAVSRWRASVVGVANALVCAAIGVATHVGWDAFTHGTSPLFPRIAWLRKVIVWPAWTHLAARPLAVNLQAACHVVGSLAAIWLARIWWRRVARDAATVEHGRDDAGAGAQPLAVVSVASVAGVVAAIAAYQYTFAIAVAVARGLWVSFFVATLALWLSGRSEKK